MQIEVNEETGEATVTEPKKVGGLGLVDFPARAVLSAIQSGVPVTSVQIPFSIADRSYADTLAVARQYNLKVCVVCVRAVHVPMRNLVRAVRCLHSCCLHSSCRYLN